MKKRVSLFSFLFTWLSTPALAVCSASVAMAQAVRSPPSSPTQQSNSQKSGTAPSRSTGVNSAQVCAGEGAQLPFAWHRNPTGYLAGFVQRQQESALNYLSGIDLNHDVNQVGVAGEIFITRFYRYLWPNAFGLGFSMSNNVSSQLNAKGSTSLNSHSTVSEAKVTGRAYELNIFIRPTFESRVISRAGIAVTVLQQRRADLDFAAAGTTPSARQSLIIQGPSATLLLESNPFSTFLIGFDGVFSLDQTFVAQEDTQKASGKVMQRNLFFWGGVRHGFRPAANHLELEIKVGAGYKAEEYKSAELDRSATYKDMPLRASIGLGFVH